MKGHGYSCLIALACSFFSASVLASSEHGLKLYGVTIGGNIHDSNVEYKDFSNEFPRPDGTKMYKFMPVYTDNEISKFRFNKAYITPISSLVALLEFQSIVDKENDCNLAKDYVLNSKLSGMLSSFKTIKELKDSGFKVKVDTPDVLYDTSNKILAQVACSKVENKTKHTQKELLTVSVFSPSLIKQAMSEKGQLVAMGKTI
ncbi:hypothetical protein [Photobacterium kishitanii]|uniref:Uncharacterized protein n=1 Tax=Photobacterium kishitanii TaxID=318456 RepID=A0A2T3KML0_9GAMM|nr:hypothetical protein [Photobacterium kishitanii]PSV01012.1 hypothetical protein C9J27_03010 [Photobacterium kishitanii]